MSKVLQRLREDHADFRAFLGALGRQMDRLERGGEVDYEIIRGVAEYFQDFADPAHHPLEEAVLERLRERAPEAAAKTARISEDHARLESEVAVFKKAIDAILQEEEVPRDQVIAAIRDFIADERRHMEAEETLFFPPAEAHLTSEDWAAAEAVLIAQIANPDLPDPSRYERLRADVAADAR